MVYIYETIKIYKCLLFLIIHTNETFLVLSVNLRRRTTHPELRLPKEMNL